MSRVQSPTSKRSKPDAKRTATAKQPKRAIDAQPVRLVPSPTFDVDNLNFDRRPKRRVDDLPPRPPRKAQGAHAYALHGGLCVLRGGA